MPHAKLEFFCSEEKLTFKDMNFDAGRPCDGWLTRVVAGICWPCVPYDQMTPRFSPFLRQDFDPSVFRVIGNDLQVIKALISELADFKHRLTVSPLYQKT